MISLVRDQLCVLQLKVNSIKKGHGKQSTFQALGSK
jgi:hypothetical protein